MNIDYRWTETVSRIEEREARLSLASETAEEREGRLSPASETAEEREAHLSTDIGDCQTVRDTPLSMLCSP